MGSDTVSAIPGQLLSWAGWASTANPDLEAAAHDLNQKIDLLNLSHPDPAVLGQVPYVGDDVLAYAIRNGSTDQWVGQVGQAFLTLATRGIPPGILRQEWDAILNGTATVSGGALDGMVGGDPTQDPGPLPADPGKRQAWWAQLTAAERQTYLRYAAPDVAFLATPQELRAAGYSSLQEVYQQQAFFEAGIDPNSWDPSKGLGPNKGNEEAVYAYYQRIFDEFPQIQWAGLAKLVGGEVTGDLNSLDSWAQTADNPWVAIGSFVFGGPAGIGADRYASEEIHYYENEFLTIQKTIFTNISWQLAAYEHGGVYATNALGASGAIAPDMVRSWSQIASGDLYDGNLGIAHFEQTLVQPFYDQMTSHFATGGVIAGKVSKDTLAPFPGGQSFSSYSPNGDLAKWPDRWAWVQGSLFPDYTKFLQSNPQAAQQLIDTPLDQLARQYSLSPWPWS